MIPGLESVTVGVGHLDTALAEFRRIKGMRIESDTRASVSLLSAWRYPVHADVRLVELSCDGRPFGRVRLAQYEADVGVPLRDFQPESALERAADAAASRRFYHDCLGLTCTLEEGLAEEFREPVRRLAGGADGVPQRMAPGRLGINLFSLPCEDLDALEGQLRALDVEIKTRPTHVALGNGTPARIMLMRGPSQELLELIERGE